jgi:TolB protein
MRAAVNDRVVRLGSAFLVLMGLTASRALAQVPDSLAGVSLSAAYGAGNVQLPLAFKPFEGRFGGGPTVAPQVQGIMAKDLKLSDRYRVLDSLPASLIGSGPLNYDVWEQANAKWLLTGQVEGSGTSFVLRLQLHDVISRSVLQQQQFTLPAPTSPDFRMAVHRVSDQVVQWTHKEPGMAATRIAYSAGTGGFKEIYAADSDGENRQRLTNYGNLAMSPSWSPDGRRLVFSAVPKDADQWGIYEMDMSTQRATKLPIVREGGLYSPVFDPRGQVIAFSVQGGTRGGLYTYNVDRRCCLTNLLESARIEGSPTFSPDGRWIAFETDRFSTKTPQVMRLPATGGNAELVSNYTPGEGYYTSPDWNPRGDQVAYHGRTTESGSFQIFVRTIGGPLRQLTSEGNNEDPSWAPDGRHIVFRSVRRDGQGLFIVDTITGTIRPFMTGIEVRTPDWSSSIAAGAGGL